MPPPSYRSRGATVRARADHIAPGADSRFERQAVAVVHLRVNASAAPFRFPPRFWRPVSRATPGNRPPGEPLPPFRRLPLRRFDIVVAASRAAVRFVVAIWYLFQGITSRTIDGSGGRRKLLKMLYLTVNVGHAFRHIIRRTEVPLHWDALHDVQRRRFACTSKFACSSGRQRTCVPLRVP